MAKLRIFVIGTRGFPDIQGGVETHCQELYTRLAQKGCDITVATRKPYVPVAKRISTWQGVNFVHLWCPKYKGIEAISHTFFGVLSAVRHSPDILHIHAIGPSIVAPLAKLLGLKVIVTNHGPDYQRAKWGNFARSVLKMGEYLGTKFADKVIVISNTVKDILKNKYPQSNLEFIPNGVTVPTFVTPGETLSRFNLEPRSYIFTAARFVEEKGLHDLVNAYRKILNPPFKLVIAGDADHETKYSRYFKELAAHTPGVILTGFVYGNSLKELFSNAGLFVLPSYHEGLPIALLEALSFNLPVLVSDIRQNQEVPLPSHRFFPLGNVDLLAQKLVDGFHAGITAEEKEAQREVLEKKYNWDIIAEQTLAVYKSLENQSEEILITPYESSREPLQRVSQ
jgi:alpha-maltose-1-phosphate synthase